MAVRSASEGKRWGSFLILLIQGALVGTGAILPGISGGVLCVAFGIYEPMMALLAHPIRSFRNYYKMFIPFLIGWGAGFVLLANGVELLFQASASVALMLFGGLICGTIPQLIKASECSDPLQSWSPFVLSLAGSFLFLSVLGQGNSFSLTPNAAWYLFCGLIWGLSLVIPGLSSSSILIYMGLYQPMTAGIAALNPAVLLPLVGGLGITVLSTARLVDSLFTRRYAFISRIVLGVMISSTLLILPQSFLNAADFGLSLGCFAAGFLTARWMDLRRGSGNTGETGHSRP